jgi:hypothetical protein
VKLQVNAEGITSDGCICPKSLLPDGGGLSREVQGDANWAELMGLSVRICCRVSQEFEDHGARGELRNTAA